MYDLVLPYLKNNPSYRKEGGIKAWNLNILTCQLCYCHLLMSFKHLCFFPVMNEISPFNCLCLVFYLCVYGMYLGTIIGLSTAFTLAFSCLFQ